MPLAGSAAGPAAAAVAAAAAEAVVAVEPVAEKKAGFENAAAVAEPPAVTAANPDAV